MRGSTAAWEILKATPEKISDDTLYFIYENAQTSRDGKLYLGLKLISGVGEGSTGDININDIGDVNIDGETLADKQILVYNDYSQRWENTFLSTIINTAVGVMTGATAASAGTSGLVPVPAAGDQNKFLQGSGTWARIDIPTFNTDIFSLDSNQNITLNGYGLATVGQVPVKTNAGIQWMDYGIGSLNMRIATLQELQQIIEDSGDEHFSDTTLYMVDNGNDSSSGNKYDEFMIINGHIERMGTLGQVDLTEYVKTSTFNTAINSIEDELYGHNDPNTGDPVLGLVERVRVIENQYVTRSEIGDLSQLLLTGDNTTLVEEVNTINNNVSEIAERLQWRDLGTNEENN